MFYIFIIGMNKRQEREERIKKMILDTLSRNRDGMSYTAISKELKMSKISVSKYIAELKGEGKVRVRIVGPVKLVYLNE